MIPFKKSSKRQSLPFHLMELNRDLEAFECGLYLIFHSISFYWKKKKKRKASTNKSEPLKKQLAAYQEIWFFNAFLTGWSYHEYIHNYHLSCTLCCYRFSRKCIFFSVQPHYEWANLLDVSSYQDLSLHWKGNLVVFQGPLHCLFYLIKERCPLGLALTVCPLE